MSELLARGLILRFGLDGVCVLILSAVSFGDHPPEFVGLLVRKTDIIALMHKFLVALRIHEREPSLLLST
jgi:hypothetical protein